MSNIVVERKAKFLNAHYIFICTFWLADDRLAAICSQWHFWGRWRKGSIEGCLVLVKVVVVEVLILLAPPSPTKY